MCTHKILSYNDIGYVSLCEQCSRLQIVFNFTILTLTAKQFLIFKAQAEKQIHDRKSEFLATGGNFCIHISCVNVKMVLSFNELQKLIFLLDEANKAIGDTNLLHGDLQNIIKESEKCTLNQLSNQSNPISLN